MRPVPYALQCRMQLGPSGVHSYAGPLQCVRDLLAEEGWRGLARGTTGTMVRSWRSTPETCMCVGAAYHCTPAALQAREVPGGPPVMPEPQSNS
jgi:hypothetical protein